MSVPAPNPADCQDLQFKALCRLRVFNGQPGLFTSSANLVAVAPLYGLIFVGTPSGFQVLPSNSIAELQASRGETSEYPRREVTLGYLPSHLSVSCDQSQLAVALVKDGCPCAIIYDVASFCSRNVSVVTTIRLASSPGSKVLDFQFNPGLALFLAACTSDGGVGVYEIKGNNFVVSTLPPATHATCLCWSPKGKQLVVGDSKGVISQYKPDLKLVKSYPPPQDKPVSSIVNLLWISNYQFAAVYADTANPSERPSIMIVNVPKGGQISYINFEDICYSAGELRPPQFYMVLQAKWNLIMVASANSMEVGVLAMAQDQVTWQQWTQEDAARAELPLTPTKQETYPIGLALDTSSTRQLPWGENQSLHPMPMLHTLSHDGVLCIFHAINILPGAPCICEAPKPLPDMSGLDQFVSQPSQAFQPPAVSQPQTQPPQPTQPIAVSQPSLLSQVPPLSQSSQLGLFSQAPPLSQSQSLPISSSLFQSAPAQPAQTQQSVPASSSSPLQQLSSMSNQFQSMSQMAKPAGFGGSGMIGGQPQPSFSSSISAASLAANSSISFSQQAVAGGASGNVLQSPKPSTPPPAYSAPTVSQVTPLPEASQRPSVLVSVPPVKSSTNSSHTQESATSAVVGETSEDKAETVDPAIYVQHIQEEIQVFENEMSKLKRLANQKLSPIGSEEEKKILFKKVEELDSSISELSKNTEDLKHDVHELKSIGMESTLWAEDARSRLRQFNKPSYLQLVKAQELDPVSARTLFNIQQKFYYLENQLSNINKQLSLEWSQYQETRSPRNRMFIPTMDEVYQTMVKQNNILLRLKLTLEDVSQRISARKLRNSNRIPLINDSALSRKSAARHIQLSDTDNIKTETDLSSLAENLLEKMQLKKHQSDDLDLESLASRALNLNVKKSLTSLTCQKHLSSKKEDKLRELLLQIPMAHIKVDRTPSEMASAGKRPCVSFSSSVLSISPRKQSSNKQDKLPSSPASAVKAANVSTSLSASSSVTVPQPSATMTPSGFGTFSSIAKPPATFAPTILSSVAAPTSSSGQSKSASKPVPNTEASRTAPNSFGSVNLTQGATQLSTSKSTPPTSGFAFNLKPASSSMSSISGTFAAPEKPDVLNLSKGMAGTSSITTSQPLTFVQPSSVSNQQSGFVSPASVGSATSKTKTVSGAQKSGDSLSALSDMVNKAGSTSVSPSRNVAGDFATTPSVSMQSKTTAASTFSFSSVPKPSFATSPAVPTSLPFGVSKPAETGKNVSVPKTQAPSPSITIHSSGTTLSSVPKQGLFASPSASSTQSFFGSSLTITPVPSTEAPTSQAATAPQSAPAPQPAPPASVSVSQGSTPVAADSTTSFFGGMGLGSAPIASSKSPASIFGGSGFQAGKTSSLFGPPSTQTATAVTATSAPVVSAFGKFTTTQSASSTSLFGSGTTTATATFGFGSLASSLSPQTSAPISSVAPAVPASEPATSTASEPANVVATSTSTVMPAPCTAALSPSTPSPATTSSSASLLGQLASSTTVTPSVFGTPASSAVTPLFGQTATTSATTPAFGQPPPVSSTTPLFGQAATTSTATTVFGQPAAAAAVTSTPSLFGAPAPATTTSASSFSFALPSISTTTAPTTSATVKSFSFALGGGTPSAAQPAFGSSPAPFGQPSTTTTTQASFFGQAICSPSATGQSTGSIFGGGTAAVSSAAATQSPFGSTPAFGSKPSFGQSGGSLFGQNSSSAASFGSPSSGSIFGGGASPSTNLFGGSSASPSGGNLFQQAPSNTGSLFGQAATSPSSGPFSSGASGTTGQTGFGSPAAFQAPARPSGFGAFQSPSQGFGSPPAFGSSPSFGAAPTFGGAPAFGSPPRTFGAAAASPGFGTTSPTQSNSTFEALATQDAGVTFGNLAQGGPTSTQQPTSLFGGSSTSNSFSSTGPSFGGNSFSSWR